MTASPPRRRRYRALAWMIYLAICVVVAELILRQFFGNLAMRDLLVIRPGELPCVTLINKEKRVLSTGYWRRTKPVWQETNALGYRGVAVPVQRTDGVARIALIGDSYVYGVGVPNESTMATALQSSLLESSRRVEVLNFGVPGQNLDEVRWHYLRSVQNWKPDLVLFGLRENDLDAPFCDNLWGFFAERDNLARFVNAMVLVRIPVVLYKSRRLERLPPENPSSLAARLTIGLDSLRASIAGTGSRFAIVALGNPLGDGGETALSDWSTSRGVPMLDLVTVANDPSKMLKHDAHLSPGGNALVADAIHGWLASLATEKGKSGAPF